MLEDRTLLSASPLSPMPLLVASKEAAGIQQELPPVSPAVENTAGSAAPPSVAAAGGIIPGLAIADLNADKQFVLNSVGLDFGSSVWDLNDGGTGYRNITVAGMTLSIPDRSLGYLAPASSSNGSPDSSESDPGALDTEAPDSAPALSNDSDASLGLFLDHSGSLVAHHFADDPSPSPAAVAWTTLEPANLLTPNLEHFTAEIRGSVVELLPFANSNRTIVAALVTATMAADTEPATSASDFIDLLVFGAERSESASSPSVASDLNRIAEISEWFSRSLPSLRNEMPHQHQVGNVSHMKTASITTTEGDLPKEEKRQHQSEIAASLCAVLLTVGIRQRSEHRAQAASLRF